MTLIKSPITRCCVVNRSRYLGSCGLEKSNEIFPLFLFLDTSENHLSTWNVLLWVFQVCEKSVLPPGDTFVHVGLRVREPSGLTSLSSKEAIEVRTLLVRFTCRNSVALRALGFENFGTLCHVSHAWNIITCSWRRFFNSVPSLIFLHDPYLFA